MSNLSDPGVDLISAKSKWTRLGAQLGTIAGARNLIHYRNGVAAENQQQSVTWGPSQETTTKTGSALVHIEAKFGAELAVFVLPGFE